MMYIFRRITKKSLEPTDQRGVTLVEMLVVMGLLSSLLVVMATIFTSSADVLQQSKDYSATLSSGRFIMARLNYDIGQASAVDLPASPGTPSSTLELSVGSDTYIYSLSGGNLQLNDGSATDNLNSDDVTISNPTFTELGTSGDEPTITYSFTVTSTGVNNGSTDTETFTSSAGLRP
jgi:prepilin-type N-terminal cleavage/methylation domain-containing protein